MIGFNSDLKELFKKQYYLPIINTNLIDEDIIKIEKLLKNNDNISCIEVTLREKNSLKNALILKEEFPTIHFGLGSILNIEMYEEAIKYNFDFFISPGIVIELIHLKISNYIPGAETVSEFNLLRNNGCNLIKFFPTTISGGSKKLQSIQTIYKDLNFIPTGGINKENINSYLELKNVLCVGMSNFD